MKKPDKNDTLTPSQHIDAAINDLPDWRGEMLSQLRSLIHETVPEITENWKWDTPIYSCAGDVFATAAFKDHVKLNFLKGAALDDPDKLFNAGLDAKRSRAIDFAEGDEVNKPALVELIRAAVALNLTDSKKKK